MENLLESKITSRDMYIDARYANTLSNIHYAPGFATYGLRGYSGKSGIDSPFIYISDTDFDKENPFVLYDKIKDNLPLSKYDLSVIEKDKNGTAILQYKQGDLVVTPSGSVYRIVEQIKSNESSPLFKYDLILNKLFDIKNDSFIQSNINSVKNLVVSDSDKHIDETKAAVTVASENSSSKKPLVNIRDIKDSVYNNLKIYYDKSRNGWVFDSDRPIFFNAASVNIQSNKIGENSNLQGYTNIASLEDYSVTKVYEFLKYYFSFTDKGVSLKGGVNAYKEPVQLDISCLKGLDMMSFSVQSDNNIIYETNLTDLSDAYIELAKIQQDKELKKEDLAKCIPDIIVSNNTVVKFNFYYKGLKFAIGVEK